MNQTNTNSVAIGFTFVIMGALLIFLSVLIDIRLDNLEETDRTECIASVSKVQR